MRWDAFDRLRIRSIVDIVSDVLSIDALFQYSTLTPLRDGRAALASAHAERAGRGFAEAPRARRVQARS